MKFTKVVLMVFMLLLFRSTVFASEMNEPLTPDEAIENALNEANTEMGAPFFQINVGNSKSPDAASSSMQLLFLITIIGFIPSILIMMTCFTRIIIALSFLRTALGTQQMPPNQVMIGIALFLTLFVMGPIFTEINKTAIEPYSQGIISQDEALDLGMEPLRKFMFAQVEDKDIALFSELSGDVYATKEDIPDRVLIPSFIIGELTKGFKFGVILYIPFIVIDMVVSSILMAMGMMMLPPSMISMPFKILLFVLAGGWNLVIENLIKTFRMV